MTQYRRLGFVRFHVYVYLRPCLLQDHCVCDSVLAFDFNNFHKQLKDNTDYKGNFKWLDYCFIFLLGRYFILFSLHWANKKWGSPGLSLICTG